jgi:hypothetical protein
MITIKKENDKTVLKIDEGTSGADLLTALEMMFEVVIKEINWDFDDIFKELKRIYLKDNEVKDER